MGNFNSRKKAAGLRERQIRQKAALEPLPAIPGFVADVMLGKLAKWLRIAGFDVLYSNRYTDEELVELSRSEQRILLSRDTRLLVQKSVRRFIYLESEKVHEQLRQVFRATGTKVLPAVLSRCLSCNLELVELPREKALSRVPPFVFATQPGFKSCPGCARIYWAGTHRQAVLTTLASMLDTTPGETNPRGPVLQ